MFYGPEYGALVGMCFLNTQTLVQRDGVESRREALGGRGENAGRRARCLGTYELLVSTCCCSNCESPGSTAQSPSHTLSHRDQRVCEMEPSSHQAPGHDSCYPFLKVKTLLTLLGLCPLLSSSKPTNLISILPPLALFAHGQEKKSSI